VSQQGSEGNRDELPAIDIIHQKSESDRDGSLGSIQQNGQDGSETTARLPHVEPSGIAVSH
jgi:hypothetical protein